MKRFLIKLSIFILPLVACFAYLEYNLTKVPNEYSYKKEQLERQEKNIRILILGSSHAELGINPAYLSSDGFNLANTSQSLYYDDKLLAKYLDGLTNLKVVILDLSYLSFEYNLSKSPAYSIGFYYDRYFDIPPESGNDLLDLRKYSLTALYGIQGSVNLVEHESKSNLLDDVEPSGFMSRYKDNSKYRSLINEDSGKRRVNTLNSMMSEQNVDQNMRYVEDIVSRLQAKKVKIIFVSTPVLKTFSDNMDPGKYQLMQNTIHLLSSRYNIPYYNYTYDKSFTIDDFGDHDHLTVRGAEKFTKILDQKMKGSI